MRTTRKHFATPWHDLTQLDAFGIADVGIADAPLAQAVVRLSACPGTFLSYIDSMRLSCAIALAALSFAPITAFAVQVTPLLPLDGETSDPALSPDRKTLSFSWCKPDYTCGIYTRPFDGGVVQLLIGKDAKEGLPTNPSWSPDGKRLSFVRVYSHYDVHLGVRDIASGEDRDLGGMCERADRISWTPDSKYLIASVYLGDPEQSSACRLVLFSAISGKRVRQIAPRGTDSALSPDGRKLAYGNGHVLMVLSLTSEYKPEGLSAIVAKEPREISGVTWAPDGRQILYQVWGDVPYVRRIGLALNARPTVISGLDANLAIGQVLADGSALATETSQIEALWRADLASNPLHPEIVKEADCTSGMAGCSPDKRRRVFITVRTGLSQIWTSNADGSNEHALVKSIPAFTNPKDDGVPSSVSWSPDGTWIAFTVFPRRGNADTRSSLYVVPASGGTPLRLGRQTYGLSTADWSRDSTAIYAVQDWPVDDQAANQKSRIVRVSSADGSITSLGVDGIWPRTSFDGRFIYFFGSARTRENVSRMPTNGGAVEPLMEGRNFLWYCVGMGARYLYLFQEPPRTINNLPGNDAWRFHKIVRFDQDSKQETELATISFRPVSAFLSIDERFLYFQQREDPTRRVVLVRGLF